MKKWTVLAWIAAAAVSCSAPNSPQGTPGTTGFAYDESALDTVLVKASQAQGTTYADFDAVILPPGSKSVAKVDGLGKYLFADEYVASLASLGGTPTVAGSSSTNTWSPDNALSETVTAVSGWTDNLVRAVYRVDSGPHAGTYHVYRYLPWVSNASGITARVWFGTGHVFYLNPVKGEVQPGQPYLELFPVSDASTVVAETRIENTSYYRFRSLQAGNAASGDTDLGSTLAKVETVLGAPDAVVPVASMNDVDWTQRDTLFTYPLSATYDGAYIHYNVSNGEKVRIFLAGKAGTDLTVKALYFVRTTSATFKARLTNIPLADGTYQAFTFNSDNNNATGAVAPALKVTGGSATFWFEEQPSWGMTAGGSCHLRFGFTSGTSQTSTVAVDSWPDSSGVRSLTVDTWQ